MKRIYLFELLLVASLMSAQSQNNRSVMFSILINDGHVIDPKNVIDDVMDIAINDVKIALIDDHIETHKATQVVDAEGMYVVPGLIDLYWNMRNRLPDGYTFRVGVTTVVNGSGEEDYDFIIQDRFR